MSSPAPPSSYLVPAGDSQIEFTEKRSRFIGFIWRIRTEEEAKTRIAAIQKEHADATHNVYAYCVNETLMRYSDDGEPQGTAGIPTLNVLRQANIAEVCCVVTRYYGGILLGAGGLVRAYSKAAKLALEGAGRAAMLPFDKLTFHCPYALFEQIKVSIAHHQGHITTSDFGADIYLALHLPTEHTPALMHHLQTLSAGSIVPKILDTCLMEQRLEEERV